MSRIDIDAPIIGGTAYPDDETEDESPYLEIIKGVVITSVMTLFCVVVGFGFGFYFY